MSNGSNNGLSMKKEQPPSPPLASVSPLLDAHSAPPLSEPELWIGRAPMRWVYAWTAHFCLNASLDGFKFLFERPQLWGFRLMWTVVVTLSLLANAVFITKALEDYRHKVIVTESETPGSWSELQFPAVTVCSLNLARKSFFMSLDLDSRVPLEETEMGAALLNYFYYGGDVTEKQEAEILALMTEKPNLTVMAGRAMYNLRENAKSMRDVRLSLAAENRTEESLKKYLFALAAHQEVGNPYFLNVTYQQNELSADNFHLLHAFFRTEMGFCSQVRESFWKRDPKSFRNFLKLSRNAAAPYGAKLGRQNGLSLVVDAEVWDYGLSRDADEGFLVSVHNIGDYPITTLAQAKVAPGTNADLGITPKLETASDDLIKRFDPGQRLCYQDDEFRFKYFLPDIYRYSFQNCMMNTARESVSKHCECDINAFNGGCYGKNLTCYIGTMANLHTYNVSENALFESSEGAAPKSPCYSACNDQKYDLYLSSSGFVNRNQLHRKDYFCMVFRKLKVVCNTPFRNASLAVHYPELCAKVANANESICLSALPVVAGEFLPGHEPQAYNESSGIPPMWTGNDEELFAGVYEYVHDNLMRINVFIRNTSLMQSVRSEKQPLIWFIANLGGLFGLATGASLISLVEVFFFLAVLLIHCCFGIENDQFPEEDGPTLEEKMMYESHMNLNAPWIDDVTDEQYEKHRRKAEIQ